MKRKNYSIIDKNISKYREGKNKNLDIYLLAYIKLCSDFNTGISNATESKLSERTTIPLRTIQSSIARLKKTQLVKVETTHNGIKKHNSYHFSLKPDNFFFVDNSFFYLDIDPKLKGFMLLVKSLCYNNTNTTLYSKTKIAELLGQDRKTVSNLIEELIKRNLLIEIKGGFQLPENYFPHYAKNEASQHDYEDFDSFDEFTLDSILDICKQKGTVLFAPDLKPLKRIFAKFPILESDISGLSPEQLKSFYLPAILESRCTSLPKTINSLDYFTRVLNVDGQDYSNPDKTIIL